MYRKNWIVSRHGVPLEKVTEIIQFLLFIPCHKAVSSLTVIYFVVYISNKSNYKEVNTMTKEKLYTTYEQTADKETAEKDNSMKNKILYATLTAVIGVTAFSIGKNFTETTQQPENINLEKIEMTEQYGGIWLDYTDGENFYSFYLTSEDLENVGYISTANIVDWTSDDDSMAIMTEQSAKDGYEWYAYKSENIYNE